MPKKINLKGPIVSDGQKKVYAWMGMDAVCPNDIISSLPKNGEEIELTVNSHGGLVDSGSEIYTALKEYEGKVTAKVVGMAASAASVIIMAADTVKISPTARIMIHNGWRYAEGDHREMESAKEALTTADKGIRSAYISKTKLSEEELTDLMNKETYMDAQKAVDLGFADEIMFQEETVTVVASLENGMLPESVLARMRTLIAKEDTGEEDKRVQEKREAMAQMRNELMREEILNSL